MSNSYSKIGGRGAQWKYYMSEPAHKGKKGGFFFICNSLVFYFPSWYIYLNSIMEDFGSRVDGEVLEWWDSRLAPTFSSRVVNFKHVIWELFAKH